MGVGLTLAINAWMAGWFVRSGIYSLSGRLSGRDGADRDKVPEAADRGKAWQRRYAEVSRKCVPVGGIMVIVGVVIVFL